MRGRPSSEPRLWLDKTPGRTPLYYIRWHDGEQRQRRGTGTGDRRQADQIFARFLVEQEDKKRGLAVSARYPHEIQIAEILRAYVEDRSTEVRFPERNLYAIKRLLAWWSNRGVDAIKPVTCDAYRDARLKEGVKLATITKELGVLRSALKWAEDNARLVGTIPKVKVPPKQDGKDRWLTRSEAARLLWAARKEPKSRLHLPLFILIGLYTGARSEAILSLKWFLQVDLERGVIDFNPPGRMRTKKGRAIVRIPRKLRWFLEKARARTTSPYVLTYHGEPITRVVKGFKSACKRAGLESVTPHTLRHTCGTWLAQQGVDLFQVGGWLGHSDPRTTKLYAHHHPDHLSGALAVFDRPRERRGNGISVAATEIHPDLPKKREQR